MSVQSRSRTALKPCPHSNTSAIDAQKTRIRLPERAAARSQRNGCSQVASLRKRLRCPRSPHTVTGPLRPDLGVAVVAGRGDLRATPPRVERVIRPFDGRVLCHDGCPHPARICESCSSNIARGVGPDAVRQRDRRRRARCRARFRTVAILGGECIGWPSGNVESIPKERDIHSAWMSALHRGAYRD